MFEQQVEIIGALELGILPLGNIDEMLNTLSPEEAHLSKRKFRKLKRKLVKRFIGSPEPGIEIPKLLARTLVHNHCKNVGRSILEKK